MSHDNLNKLIRYIEEQLRASENAGLEFVDTRNYKERLSSNQNHVIFGRRGAGKSSLIASLKQESDNIRIKLNLEDYKDISFPNIVINVLMETLIQLDYEIKKRFPIWKLNFKVRDYKKRINLIIKKLEKQLHEPDEAEESQRSRNYAEEGYSAGLKYKALKAVAGYKEGTEQEVSRSVTTNKLEFLRKELTN